jgi:uncharacterized membrane protein (DUF2068 family)
LSTSQQGALKEKARSYSGPFLVGVIQFSDAGALRHAAHWGEVEIPALIPEPDAPAVERAVAQAGAAQSNAPVAVAPVLAAERVVAAVEALALFRDVPWSFPDAAAVAYVFQCVPYFPVC